MRRVISDEDCRFLAERMNRTDLAEKVRVERQRILRLYLGRMRSDFLAAWSLWVLHGYSTQLTSGQKLWPLDQHDKHPI